MPDASAHRPLPITISHFALFTSLSLRTVQKCRTLHVAGLSPILHPFIDPSTLVATIQQYVDFTNDSSKA